MQYNDFSLNFKLSFSVFAGDVPQPLHAYASVPITYGWVPSLLRPHGVSPPPCPLPARGDRQGSRG